MCTCECVCVYLTCLCIWTQTYIHIYSNVYMHVNIHVHDQTLYFDTYIHTYICIYVCTYTHIHKYTDALAHQHLTAALANLPCRLDFERPARQDPRGLVIHKMASVSAVSCSSYATVLLFFLPLQSDVTGSLTNVKFAQRPDCSLRAANVSTQSWVGKEDRRATSALQRVSSSLRRCRIEG